jgi:hypothetical protein
MSGTQGLSYRLEGIEINLTGEIADYYDVYYRVHAQDFGWLGWAKNGEMSGTSGLSKRLEAIQIVQVAKGGAAPGNVAGVSSVVNDAAVTPESDLLHNWVEYSYVKLEPTIVTVKNDYVYYANRAGEEVAYYYLGDWFDPNGNVVNDRYEEYECYYVHSFVVPCDNTNAIDLIRSLALDDYGVWYEDYWSVYGQTTREGYQTLLDSGRVKSDNPKYWVNCNYRIAFKVSDIFYLESLGIEMGSYANGLWMGFDGEIIHQSRVETHYEQVESEKWIKHTYYVCSDCGATKDG